MATINEHDKVISGTINNKFKEAVIDKILEDAVDISNPPTVTYKNVVYTCIQDGLLGDKKDLPSYEAIDSGTIITAMDLYNKLVEIVHVLTRVGTYSYILRYKSTDDGKVSYSNKKTAAGKALFNDSYIKTLATVTNPIASNEVIQASTMNTLMSNLLKAWNNTSKHANTKTDTLCHTNCHNDCHNNCNANDNCYK